MAAISNDRDDVIVKLTPGGDLGLAHLSDAELLANTRRLVGSSNQLLAALLAHLAEVEARGVHRTRRCASLYTYCIYELRFSEDAAARRSAAARLVKQFPVLFEAIANGELHLTGLLMIGPHLTSENHVAVLGRAKFRTKKELGKLVRDLNPLPAVPDRIEPLGPEPVRAARNPTWEQYVTSLAPPIRELPIGERPRDWTEQVAVANEVNVATDVEGEVPEVNVADAEVASGASVPGGTGDGSTAAGRVDRAAKEDRLPVGPVPRDLPPVTGPQYYQVQFSAVEEHARLVERAKALLARTRPGVTLGELHLEAMKLLVASLEKRKFAVNDRPSPASAKHRGNNDREHETPPRQRGNDHHADNPPRQRGDQEDETSPRQRGDQEDETSPRQRGDEEDETSPRQRGDGGGIRSQRRDEREITLRTRSRYVPAAERREVYHRDDRRCTYVDARGERCCETRYLELHHLQPFALNGPSEAANLTLLCSAHNALAAEHDFGGQLVNGRRDSKRHEALARQTLVNDEVK